MSKHFKVSLIALALTLVLALPVVLWAKDKAREWEQTVKLSDCPAAVQKAIQDQAGGGKILEVEMETINGMVTYEAEVKLANGKKVDIKVAADGKLINGGDEDEDEDEDETEDEDTNQEHEKK